MTIPETGAPASTAGPAPIVALWLQLRATGQTLPAAPLFIGGLPERAKKVVVSNSAVTAQDILALDPEQLLTEKNLGRRSLEALLAEIQRAFSPEAARLTFVELVDALLATTPECSSQIIRERFERNRTLLNISAEFGLTRERVRQIESKFLRTLKECVKRDGVLDESVLDDGFIEPSELGKTDTVGTRASGFYVALARAAIGGGRSAAATRQYYNAQLDLLSDEIRGSDDYLTGSFAAGRVWTIAQQCAPSLAELPRDQLLRLIAKRTRSLDTGGVLLGAKPAVGRLIRALIRKAGGTCSVALLVEQLGSVLASYGESSYFDTVRMRGKLALMADIHMLDEYTATIQAPNESVINVWIPKVVAEILAARRPYSILRFLETNEEAPFDAFALASMLRSQAAICHVGRRLYTAANLSESNLRTWQLILQALEHKDAPMTRGELLAYVRTRRDLQHGQIENYFDRVPGLVRYTRDIVGLSPLTRGVMIQILSDEGTVLSLLRLRRASAPIHVSDLWLLENEPPDFLLAEEEAVMAAARSWSIARAEQRSGGLFFSVGED